MYSGIIYILFNWKASYLINIRVIMSLGVKNNFVNYICKAKKGSKGYSPQIISRTSL